MSSHGFRCHCIVLTAALAALVVGGVARRAQAHCQAEELRKLLASDAAADDLFGLSVAVSGDTAVIGANWDDHPGGSNAGSAYIFVRSAGVWVQHAKLTASDAAPDDEFGSSVSVSGNTVVIGAFGDDHSGKDDTGSAYVFVKPPGGWVDMTETAKLTASDAEVGDHFGVAVSVSGNWIVSGASWDDHAGKDNAGSAYLFVKPPGGWSGMTETAKLTAFDAEAGDGFGNSISVSFNDAALIGAHGDDHPGTDNAGSAYIFQEGAGWQNGSANQVAKLISSDVAAYDQFGVSVAIAGDLAVIGAAFGDHTGMDNAGSAYIFEKGAGWQDDYANQAAKLMSSDAATGDYFGWSAAISGNTAVVGAHHDGNSRGSAYVFEKSGGAWAEQAKLTAFDGAAGDAFGYSVSVSGDTAVFGAYTDDHAAGNWAGSAYVFGGLGDCNSNGLIDICDIDAGTSGDCNTNGTPDECEIAAGTSIDCNTNGVPDECEPDCNNNGVSDECDIAAGTSQDTNTDGVPDECEYGCVSTELAKLFASDAAAGDLFGNSVSVSGDTAVIGAFGDDDAGGVDAGGTYVFVRSRGVWMEQARLTASDAAANDSFGVSVSISGDTAVIGAYRDEHAGGTNAGSTYVFVRSGGVWTEQAKLTASDAAANDSFGVSVSISGDTAVIGAYQDDHAGGTNAGSAYVFVRSGGMWTEQAKLTASDTATSDNFGVSVSISGDTAVIGAYHADHGGGADAGSAYVFVRSGGVWTEQAKLTASDAASGDYFGESVSVSYDTAVIGAYYDDHAGRTNAGSAYVFVRSGGVWTEQSRLTASEPATNDYFGCSVSVSGDTAMIGADGDNHEGGSSAGSAYVFVRSGGIWTERVWLSASDTAVSDRFGFSVTVSADMALIGALNEDHAGGADAGSVYVFGGLGDCNTNGISDTCDIYAGTSPDANTNGVPDECETVPLFTAVVSYLAGVSPRGIASADLDEDGDADLAVANSGGSDVSILINDGVGVFAAPITAPAGSGPWSVAAGDLDGNGVADLAVANWYSNDITVLLNQTARASEWVMDGQLDNGAALVAENNGVPLYAGVSGGKLYVATFDARDGNDRFILLAGSPGALQPAPWAKAGQVVAWEAYVGNEVDNNWCGWFDATGATTVANGGGSGYLEGTIDLVQEFGGMVGQVSLAVAAYPTADGTALLPALQVPASINGDGNVDAGEYAVFTTFVTQAAYAAGNHPAFVTLADVNGDGDSDLVVANNGSNDVSILVNQGNGTFADQDVHAVGAGPYSVAVDDLDGDGDADLAVANIYNNSVSVLLKNGDGTFAAPSTYGAGTSPYSVAVADLNGDYVPDLAVANAGSDDVSVLLNLGDGTFAPQVTYGVGAAPQAVAIADLDDDGYVDLAVANWSSDDASILLNHGDGTFADQEIYSAGDGPASIAVADLDGDAALDVAVANYYSNNISVLLNQLLIVPGDFDGDLDVDLDDLDIFAACISGPDGFYTPECHDGDFDDDGDIDVEDFAKFQQGFTGPLVASAWMAAHGP